MLKLRRLIFAAALAALMTGPAFAQLNTDTYFSTPGGGGVNGAVGMCLNTSNQAVPCSAPSVVPGPVSGAYPFNVPGSTVTRPNDTTAYTASASAPQTVCAAKTVTACVPGTIALAAQKQGRFEITRVTLLKSGSTTTAASFILWFYAGAPGVASPTQFDATAYTGPRAADMPNYIGNATCSTGVATSDTSAQVWYECTLSNPNTSGALIAQALSNSLNINYLLTVTGAYAPAANETFTPYVSGF
jgi:hypothetical protein